MTVKISLNFTEHTVFQPDTVSCLETICSKQVVFLHITKYKSFKEK